MPESLQVFKADFFRALAHPVRIRILEALTPATARSRSCSRRSTSASRSSPSSSPSSGASDRHARKVGTTVRYALSDPLVTRLLAVAREIFNNHLVDPQSMLKALQREARR